MSVSGLQVIAQEPVKVHMKVRMFVGRIWNIWDMIAIAGFGVAVALRCFPEYVKDAQVVYTVDLVLWNMRILEILSVNQYLGPYVKIIAKLIRDMAYYLIILFIVVTSYGVVRQVIQYQNQPMTWTRKLRNVWFFPYWMIYGELFAEEIDPCELDEAKCSIYAAWVSPAVMCIYLLIANILGVNLLIARFNATFIKNNAYSREIWMYQRYQLIIEYEMRPTFPPPLILINHLYLAFKYIRRRCKGKRDNFDNGLKLFLSEGDTEKLHDFEEECVEDYFREKENKFQSSSDERIRVVNERVETMSLRLEDVNTKESSMRLSVQNIDYRLGRLEEIAASTSETLDILRTLMLRQMPPPPSPSPSGGGGRMVGAGVPGVTITQHSGSVLLDDMSDIDADATARGPSPGPSVSSWNTDTLGPSTTTSERELKCMPSPLLVHSCRRTHEDQLERFTSYSRTRQLSGESFSVVPESETKSHTPPLASDTRPFGKRNKSLRATLSDTSAVLQKNQESQDPSTNLQQRRSGGNKLSLDVTKAQTRARSSSMVSTAVRFKDPVVHIADPSTEEVTGEGIFSTAPIQCSTSTATTPRFAELDLTSQHLSVGLGHGATTPISPVMTPLSPVHPHIHTSTDVFTTPDPDVIPSSAVRDLCSVFTPHHGEYYTITDNIDVSCFRNLSPPRSPTPSAGPPISSAMAGFRNRAESTSSKVKQEELMEAEETERLKMEGLIRHRLRQISQDDSSGSISDIARLVVSEMDVSASAIPLEDGEGNSEEEEEEGSGTSDSMAGPQHSLDGLIKAIRYVRAKLTELGANSKVAKLNLVTVSENRGTAAQGNSGMGEEVEVVAQLTPAVFTLIRGHSSSREQWHGGRGGTTNSSCVYPDSGAQQLKGTVAWGKRWHD
ncbi:hypothetical protein ACOMHN_034779 [Nucella lapillus]